MKPDLSFLTRHRRLLLIALLSVTMLISSEANRRRLEEETVVTALPVTQQDAAQAVAVYTSTQADQHAQDVAALTALIDREDIDAHTRDDAAEQLLALITNRERAQALEAALADTVLAPCAAVVTGTQVTLVTAKTEVTAQDSALALTLAAAHCGSGPEEVRIITAK